ncbi:MAG: reverse transcriptase domain-containing protein [Anaerolineae bacterium]|nr:reverse transcriptase domain-containing protein [Anaerolineae bacterium]
MFRENQNFITRTKLAELRRQRSRLREEYSVLREKVTEIEGLPEQLQHLYQGLQTIAFARQPLHPDIQNLDLLFGSKELASEEVLRFWLDQLQRELQLGQQRAEYVYIFGALLDQWISEPTPAPTENPEVAMIREQLLTQAQTPPIETTLPDWVQALLIPFEQRPKDALKEQDEQIQTTLSQPITPELISGTLKAIKNDIYRPVSLRRQAAEFLENEMWMKELADALTILIDHLDEWDWDQAGIGSQIVWTRNKWRLFLDEDLATACLLHVLGVRWQGVIDSIYDHQKLIRLMHAQTLQHYGAPQLIVDHEGKLKKTSLMWLPLVNVWEKFDLLTPEDQLDPKKLQRPIDYHSIAYQRNQHQKELRDMSHWEMYTGAQNDAGSMEKLVTFVNAEVQTMRGALPDQPLYVVKLDLKDFYPSIPHHLILVILKSIGLPQEHLTFFERYLRVPLLLKRDQAPVITQRGISNDHLLSHVLGEMVLRLMDQHVRNQAQVQIIRLVDDICLIGDSPEAIVKAWQAALAFCDGCGLAINLEKSGAVCIGGDLPSQLPQTAPTWMLLQLNPDATWTVNTERFNAHLEQTRAALQRAPSIISRVTIYNANLNYLLRAIGVVAPLGDQHRVSVNQAVIQFHTRFDGQAITEQLRALIRREFDSTVEIPEAWLYWPITAGGLGLIQPLIDEGMSAKSYRERLILEVPNERTDDWLYRNNLWSAYYANFFNLVTLHKPEKTQVMETLVDDFIQRGSTITAGRQKDLGAYWRWILYLYGPKILDYFGTFRFLITELVPVQLISERRMGDTSLTGETGF